MTARILPFARAEHADATAVPSGAVPRPLHRDTVAATHRSERRVGGGLERQCVSHDALVAPTTGSLGTWSVVGAQIGPVGAHCLGTPRPGHHGGDAA